MIDARPGQSAGATAPVVWMVGDSTRCDRDGALAVGIEGHYLDRSGASAIQNLEQFQISCLSDRCCDRFSAEFHPRYQLYEADSQ